MQEAGFSIIILPLLKTSGPVTLAGIRLRSTDDHSDLPEGQALALGHISAMLFAQDDFRIERATYAVIERLPLDVVGPVPRSIAALQSVIAYLYTTPHDTLGKPFLSSDHATLIIITPDGISPYLVRPGYNTVPPSGLAPLPDDVHAIPGYSCLYNLQHHFWVVPGSRIYPPIPHPTLNISQDLEHDVEQASANPTYALLFRLIDDLDSRIAARALTALKWYNAAHRHNADEMAAIVHLAIAFEALLGLPPSEKTDRLVDSIALLLGRVPRLDAWAHQFYDARSSIVHEGAASDLDFVPPRGSNKESQQRLLSLLSYGTQIFRLCLGTLLVGADMAIRAGLEEKLTSNQERYEALCRLLGNDKITPEARLEAAADIVLGLERFRFSSETGLRLESLLGTVRLAAKALLASSIALEDRVRTALTGSAEASRSRNHLPELEALSDLQKVVPGAASDTDARATTVYRLVKVVWSAVFMHYFWLKRQSNPQPSN